MLIDRREEGTRKDRRTDGGRVPMCAAGAAPASTLPGGHSQIGFFSGDSVRAESSFALCFEGRHVYAKGK